MHCESNKLFPNNEFPLWLLVILVTSLGVGIGLRFEFLDYVVTHEWQTRDFERAFNILEGDYFPLAGPELTNGGRLPGPFLYFFLAIPLLFDASYEAIFFFNFLINVGSLIGIFFIAKKYFNFCVASVSTAFLSLHVLGVCAILFPINPTFIFPFLTLYTWFFLEFIFNKNHRAIFPLVLSICLGVQIHYSIATYILPPLILAIFFPVKIPIKTVFYCLILIAFCFSPYFYFKQIMFMASNQEVPTGDSVGNIFEVISLGHMSHYLQNWSLNFVTNTTMPLIYRAINFGAGIVSFYVLLGIVLIRIRRGSWRANRNGICILAFFYFPALIYGVLKPIGLHFWYSYIFLIPESLIIGFCVHSIFGYLSKSKSSVHRTLRVSFIALTLITFLLLNIMLINYTSQSVKNVEHAQPNLYTLMPHKNVQSILHSLMTSLSLSPDEFYQRVYTFDFKDTSGRMLRSPEVNVLENNGGSQKKKEKPCYLVKVKESKDQVMTELQYRRLEMFLKDSTINILSKEYVSMHKVGVSGIFEIYTYEPIFNQSCYYNNFNMFIVDKRIRDLVINAKDVLKSKEVVSIKAVMVTPKYNSNQELENLDGYYVIVHRISQNPFGFFLSIKRDGEDYLIRGTIQSIYFHRTPHPQPKTMDLIFRQAFQADPTDNLMKGPEGVTSRRNETRLNILSENTLASEANFPASPRSSYNQYWHREFKIPSQLIQGKQDVYLAWSQPVKVPDGPTRQSVKVEELEIKLSLNPT